MGDQRVEHRPELAIDYLAELVQGQADAVIGDAILREVVGADFFRADRRS